MGTKQESQAFWQFAYPYILALVIVSILLASVYAAAIQELIRIWGANEEYSYGYMIPFITAFLIWQRKDRLEKIEFTGAWSGVLLVVVGAFIYLVGELSTLYLVVQYSLIVVTLGVALSITGWQAFRIIVTPLLFLAFMIPLPQFFLSEISQQLQFVSSEIGVAVIRLFDISVYLEGNVIDLGSYKLQVVEACSGLRYLFPLMALGFIMAYFFNGAFWKKALIFLSTIPITVLMNSFRIGAIGVMVEYWGIEMAEGFLHDFEGWIIFMACFAILIAEMWFLARLGPEKKSFSTAFGIDMPEPASPDVARAVRKMSMPFYTVMVAILVMVSGAHALPDRQEITPERKVFTGFPMTIGEWKGRNNTMESIYLDVLKLDDYLLADYSDGSAAVNLYMAYYASQRRGQSAHSPRTCIPGGGWKINDISQIELSGSRKLKVNRVDIQKGGSKQVVYYWFQGRGRNITNEYLVKWFIFWDSMNEQRTDGALVRLTVFVPEGGDIMVAEQKLQMFAEEITPLLDDYIPD